MIIYISGMVNVADMLDIVINCKVGKSTFAIKSDEPFLVKPVWQVDISLPNHIFNGARHAKLSLSPSFADKFVD